MATLPTTLTLLCGSTAALLTVYVLALASSSSRNRPGYSALLALLAVNAFLVARIALMDLLPQDAAFLRVLSIVVATVFFLIPSLLYRYVRETGRGVRTERLMLLWHATPAIGWLMVFIVLQGLYGMERSLLGPEGRLMYTVTLNGLFIGYYVAAWRAMLAIPRDRLGRRLPAVLVLFGVHWSFSAASGLFALGADPDEAFMALLEILSVVNLFVFASAALWDALRRQLELDASAIPSTEPLLNADALAALIDHITRYLEEEQPYLDPELTLEDLADGLGEPARIVSYALNAGPGGGFFEVINTCRVDEARRMLEDPACRHLTVLEILYAAGFNSKSAFHRAFRKATGITPSAYRARASASPARLS